MAAATFMRFRREIAIGAIATLAAALLALASLMVLDWLSARLSLACRGLLPDRLAAPHAAPWRVAGAPAPCRPPARRAF